MEEKELQNTELLNSCNELRRLIIENPDLPLIVFAGEDATNGEHYGDLYYMNCSYVRADVGEYLDCKQEVDESCCYTDRDYFERDLYNILQLEYVGTDEEWEHYFEKKLAEYKPYWKKCIILYVDNKDEQT